MAQTADIHPLSSNLHHCTVFIAGPTAVGKSAVALALAEKIGGEIITVDSMQVYRGLDIGTAKPTAAERARVPHHLLDICEPSESFDASQFIHHAHKAVTEILARGKTPIFCGGTGLYFKAYLEGLGEAPPADEKLRAELNALPYSDLLDELRERDPVAYEKIDRQNPRRVIRAVEVIRLTGKRFSEQRAAWKPAVSSEDRKDGNLPSSPLICLTRNPEDLNHRINVRVDEMFARGLVEETRALLPLGLAENKFALQAIGYRQVVEHLRGERGLTETIELVKVKTRQFAKRQLTWFRRQSHCRWIPLAPEDSPAKILDRISD